MKKGFTLLELVVVIVILGILATLGFTQYNKQVEYARLAEAKTAINSMRQRAIEYYWKNGSMDGIQSSDVGADYTCTSTSFYKYLVSSSTSLRAVLSADRCTSGGKTPNTTREYRFQLRVYPSTGRDEWNCYYLDDSSTCFGIQG